MSLETFARAVDNVRLDAIAGFTRCTPGKTVPCGRVCRQPKNCAKGKGTAERKNRIGEANLNEFREARRSHLSKKKQSASKTSEQQLADVALSRWGDLSEAKRSKFLQQAKDQAVLARRLMVETNDSALRHKLAGSAAIWGQMLESLDYNQYEAEGLVFAHDNKGTLQGAAIVDNRKRSISVEFIATSPVNLIPDHPQRTKGVGTKIMADVIRTAVKEGKTIGLEAVSDAIPFYQKIGFTFMDDFEGALTRDMRLSTMQAKDFLDKMKIRYDTEEAPNTFLDELLALEDLALGQFVAPKRSHKTIKNRIDSLRRKHQRVS